jgi:glycogen debranching enzyme
MPLGLHEWLDGAPKLETSNDSLQHIYRQSLLDLAALRIRPDNVELETAMLGGGIPWYMAVFGRDSIIAAYQALPFRADLAAATLKALADLQATEWDNFRDAEPGKILHELRRGVLAALGRVPHSPYYGTHDATLLWLILLDEYERWTGDKRLVRELEANARAAIEWMEGPADLDGDGFLEYRKRSEGGNALDNHCWKDSADGIVFPDGRRAEPPIATCEIQGYAFDARRRCARLAREVWRDNALADRLERAAVALQRRFNRDFWSARRRCYVLALDGNKQQVDSVTSNIGHLLWSGIVDERRARAVVRRLLARDLFSGWGVRTLSAEHPAHNPLAYHRGTVWPHDTAIVAEGLRRYGFRDEAAKVCAALFDAAVAFDNELPELFGGFARDETRTVVEYPDALRPQAWASGAPLLMLRTLLGLDVEDGRLRSRPHVPDSIGRVRLRGLRVRGRKFDTR